jgi:SAM-dependent methyltransferase
MSDNAFDPAARTFEAARAFPPGIADVVAAGARTLAPTARDWFEVGVGTGRIARPLCAQQVRLVGIDRSAGMLAQLRANWLPAAVPLPVVQADVTRLPLAAAVADAVVAVHVLQLIANWHDVVAEVRRLLRPGGAFLLGYEWRPPDSPGARLRRQWDEIVRTHGGLRGEPGTVQPDFTDISAVLVAEGAALTERTVGAWTLTRTLARQIETIEHRTWSTSWGVSAEFFAACLADLRAWTVTTYGALDLAFEVPHRFIWQRFVWPA